MRMLQDARALGQTPHLDMTPRGWLFAFLGALTLLRLAFAAQLELFPDESYYFMWSERMDICYSARGRRRVGDLAGHPSFRGE